MRRVRCLVSFSSSESDSQSSSSLESSDESSELPESSDESSESGSESSLPLESLDDESPSTATELELSTAAEFKLLAVVTVLEKAVWSRPVGSFLQEARHRRVEGSGKRSEDEESSQNRW
ncbi:hypothetical protein QBC38DRAFT_447436 [Podospora fimiseda]|uniref:Uncharacterized protein n=1 Tax=Podospora fimiseda TaxID=252190 RepID=A0AAN7GX07_9PEZI|nr:hypothetical protein QBC38DRAFT_447436 [Podospora fimiseda]